MPNSPLEVELQEHWFRAQDLPAPDLTLHEDDEMARLDLQKTTPERRRMFYMRTGYEACLVLENALIAAGRSLSGIPALLDFACGYGRVLRFLVRAAPPEAVHASDIIPAAVEFVRETFSVNAFPSRVRAADIRFPQKYQVICVFSLFSHLPRESFKQYLRVLHDQLEPDGLLLFSTHTPHVLSPAERDPSGFTFKAFSGIPYLDPAEYGSAFVSPDAVRAICAELGIRHLYTLERELWRIQDVHVVTRSPAPGLSSWKHAPVVRGAILVSEQNAQGVARAGGYVRLPPHALPLADVTLVVDGRRRIPCQFAAHPLPMPESEGGRFFTQIDWLAEGPAQELLGGTHVLAATARTAAGVRGCFDVAVLRSA